MYPSICSYDGTVSDTRGDWRTALSIPTPTPFHPNTRTASGSSRISHREYLGREQLCVFGERHTRGDKLGDCWHRHRIFSARLQI